VRSLVAELPDSPEAAGLRFAACLSILNFGGWRMGMPEDEIAAVYADGRTAAEQLGQPQMVGAMIIANGVTRGMLGYVEEAIAFADEARAIAVECADTELLAVTLGVTYWLGLGGRLAEALARVEELIELARGDPNLGRATMGFSAHAWATLWRGQVLGDLGQLGEARIALDDAVRLARDYEDLETLGWALGTQAGIAWLIGDPADSLACAREAAEIAERSGSSFSRVAAYLELAYAHNVRAESGEAKTAAERALEIIHEARTGLQYEPLVLTSLAQAKAADGDYPGAVQAAEEAIRLARERGTRVYEINGSFTLARALRGRDGAVARDRATELLADAMSLANECGAAGHIPYVHVELAELSRLDDDEEGYERELREAQRQFEEIGATGRAAEVASQLAALPA
jgi:tetratricopeptide (TPR) repeat protein